MFMQQHAFIPNTAIHAPRLSQHMTVEAWAEEITPIANQFIDTLIFFDPNQNNRIISILIPRLQNCWKAVEALSHPAAVYDARTALLDAISSTILGYESMQQEHLAQAQFHLAEARALLQRYGLLLAELNAEQFVGLTVK